MTNCDSLIFLQTEYKFDRQRYLANRGSSVMDIWITSSKESLLDFVANEMKAYRLYTVVPRLTKFIDQLTNWYVRLNRSRIKGNFGREQCIASLDTLFDVLDAMSRMMAPFTPFLAEFMFQRLVELNPQPLRGSVHYQMMPAADRAHLRTDVELSVARMQSVIELGRVLRDRHTMPTKYPVPEVVVIHKHQEYLADVQRLEDFVLGELNVRKLTVCAEKERYGVKLRAEPDHKVLGVRLKNTFKAVMAAIKQLTDADIQAALRRGHYEVEGERIELEEVRVIYYLEQSAAVDGVQYEAHSDNDVLVLMDLRPSQELLDEGNAREIINRVQKLKKKAKLVPTDAVRATFEVIESKANAKAKKPVQGEENVIVRVLRTHHDMIQTTIKSPLEPFVAAQYAGKRLLISETFEIKDVQLRLCIYTNEDVTLPAVDWLNVLWYPAGSDAASPRAGTVLLENRSGLRLTVTTLLSEVDRLFGLSGRRTILQTLQGDTVSADGDAALLRALSGQTLVLRGDFADSTPIVVTEAALLERQTPYAQFVNVTHASKRVTIIVENPQGSVLDSGDAEYVQRRAAKIFTGVAAAELVQQASRSA